MGELKLVFKGRIMPLYLFVPVFKSYTKPCNKYVLANMVDGPSYVTAQTAFSYWGLIPERVELIINMTAGNPMDEKVRWIKLRAWEIVESLKNEYGIEVSRKVVRQLLKRHDYRLCKA